MKPITIRMLTGVNAGRARTFEQAHLTFGRDANNDIVVEVPLASRRHGELVCGDDDVWYVVNQSANGSTLNGKKLKKQTALKTGDVIGVGGEKMFDVEIIEPQPTAGEPAPVQKPTEPEKPKMSGKNKLYIGIGIYFFAMMIVLFAATQLIDRDGRGGSGKVPELSEEQIAAEIVAEREKPYNMREANKALELARQRNQLADREVGALYEAHKNFKLAHAYSNGELFADGMVFREFKKAETDLIEQVTKTYALGYAQLRSKQWDEAEATLRKLLQIYPDTNSRIHDNVLQQLRIARSHGM